MKIVELRAENVKRLKAVTITPDPDGNVVVLSGRNAQGKSSVLDSIWAALNVKAAKIDDPIRHGADAGEVTLTLDDLVVKRRWTKTGTTLTVTSRDGKAKMSGPQGVIDSMVGALAFDPLAFAMSNPKTQRASLIEIADLPFDPVKNSKLRAMAYSDRTTVNRDVKRLRAELESLPEAPTKTGPTYDVAEIATRLQAETLRVTRLHALKSEWERNEQQIATLQARNAAIVKEGNDLRALPADHLPAPALEAMLADAEKTAAARAAEVQRAGVQGALRVAEKESADLTAEIERLDAEKNDGLAAAHFPVRGLSFDDDGVLYNGVPFAQSSAAERLMVSTAIAMAANPELRVICIRDASLLDKDNLALLERVAADRDYQLWLETVHDTGSPAAVVIEDGMVQSA